MKVEICKTIDVNAEVEVDVSDVLADFSDRIEQASALNDLPFRSVFLPLVDFALKLMLRIPAGGIGRCSDEQRKIVADRLRAEAERWVP